jgi:hypothetical protein
MTTVDVVFRYARAPGPAEMRAVDSAREVYGIRRIRLDEKEKTLRVEYDASRLNEATVVALLRRAGIDLLDRLTPA